LAASFNVGMTTLMVARAVEGKVVRFLSGFLGADARGNNAMGRRFFSPPIVVGRPARLYVISSKRHSPSVDCVSIPGA
jgi:hypothetical protein